MYVDMELGGQKGRSTVIKHHCLSGGVSPERKLAAGCFSSLEGLERARVFYFSLPIEETLFHRKQTSPWWTNLSFFPYLSPSTGFSYEKDQFQDLYLLAAIILSVLQGSKVATLLTFSGPLFIWPMNNYAKQISSTLEYSKWYFFFSLQLDKNFCSLCR